MKAIVISILVLVVVGLLVLGVVRTSGPPDQTAREPNVFDDLFFAVLGVSLSEPPIDHGPHQELQSCWAETPPEIDGILAAGEWTGAATVAIDATDRKRPGVASRDSDTHNYRQTGGILPYESNHATIYVMNDADSLYVAVDVIDDVLDFSEPGGQLWRGDSVEVRVDGNLSRERHKERNRFGRSIIVRGSGDKATDDLNLEYVDWAASVKEDQSGYVIELRFDAEEFTKDIGFDVAINDSDDPHIQRRHAQYYWNGTRDSGYQDEREWGVVHLASEDQAVPRPKIGGG